jgi:hypothetical protein
MARIVSRSGLAAAGPGLLLCWAASLSSARRSASTSARAWAPAPPRGPGAVLSPPAPPAPPAVVTIVTIVTACARARAHALKASPMHTLARLPAPSMPPPAVCPC